MSVYLVGAGPGDADLLSVRAARLLARADVVVHDRLVDRSVLALANAGAALYDVGKTPGRSLTQPLINELLIDLARRHDVVVRLKGGDPFVFGRGGEEVLALRDAGIATEVVPGLSSALAGPLAAGIPVTHRGLSRGVMIVSARGEHGDETDFTPYAHAELTLVVLMGVSERRRVVAQLVAGGLDRDTPCAVIVSAWTSHEDVTRCSLHELADVSAQAPAVLVIGRVAALDLSREFATTLRGVAP